MKALRWKIAICLVPVLLSLLVIGISYYNYVSGVPLRIAGHELTRLKFKLGVDLVGGTILVYEIDPEKKPERYDKDQLVSALKRRLDPADLYNITIRPLSDTRVEIILPTGGRQQVEAQKKAWDALLEAVHHKWPNTPDDPKKFKARRGEVGDLADEILESDKTVSSEEIETFIKEHWVQDRSLTGDEVATFKSLIQRVGSLEFRFLANRNDDKEALDEARRYFDAASTSWKEFLSKVKTKYPEPDKEENGYATVSCGDLAGVTDLIRKRYGGDPARTREIDAWIGANFSPNTQLRDLIKRAESGQPPPPPLGGSGKYFTITLNDGPHRVSYSWVEIGKNELNSLRLYNDYPAEAQKEIDNEEKEEKKAEKTLEYENAMSRRRQIAEARASGVMLDSAGLGVHDASRDFRVPIYSRKIINTVRLSKKDKEEKKQYEYYFLSRDPEPGKEVTGEFLTSASEGAGRAGDLAVDFRFNAKGESRFFDLTSANSPPPNDREARRYLAIVLDGQIMSAPGVETAIRGSGQIHGKFSKEEIDRLVNILRSGALPATLKPQPVSENTMGATLGDDTIAKGTMAIGIAFASILVFMLIYYRFAGFVACVALIANLLMTIAFMVAVNATFTLPGLAGLVLTLGMAVDANVLIYERLREERERGASLSLALRNGYDRALPTIIDTHLTSIFTAIVLYIVGNDQLKGFGISLTVGLLISLFTSLYMTRVMFRLWEVNGWLKELSMAKLLTKTRINFMGIRKPVFIATVTTAIIGVAIFLARGTRSLNMDFIGGTVYSGVLSKAQSIDELRGLLEDEGRQRKVLALDKDPVYDSDRGVWIVTYADGSVREIHITEKLTAAELRARAEVLPEPSLELIDSSSGVSEGNRSTQFTVRTTEKSAELVAASVSRLLGDLLEKPELDRYDIQQLTLLFPKPLTLDQARELVLPVLQKKEIIPTPDAKKQEELKRGLSGAELAGQAVAVAGRAIAAGDDAVLDGKDPGVKAGTFKAVQLRLKKPADGEKLLAALQPLAEGEGDNKKLEVQVNDARLYFSRYVLKAQVKSLLDTGFRGLVAQEVQLSTEGSEERDDRYDSMLALLPAPIEGNTFRERMQSFATELKERPLPIRLENFDSQLAADMQQRALYAIVASWGAILMYLWFRFGNWTFGLAAVLCLIHDVCMTLGVIAVCHYVHGTFISDLLALRDFKIDLPAVAALLTLIGFSVNDTIVVFDRIREVRGKNPNLTPEMINDSVNQTLSRTILTSLTAWLVVAVLYIWGGEGVHLFAFVMVVGVIVGTLSSIFVASPLLLILGEGSRGTALPERPREEVPAETGGEEGEEE